MAPEQSVLSELLAAFQSGEWLDLIRESVRLVYQELIETELSALIGADVADHRLLIGLGRASRAQSSAPRCRSAYEAGFCSEL